MGVDVVELLPRLVMLRFPVGQAYVWRDGANAVTLVDAGSRVGRADRRGGDGPGRAARSVRRVLFTHFHEDHAGGAAEVAALTGAEVLAHRLDAPHVRGDAPGPPPALEDWEGALHRRALSLLPPGEYERLSTVTELSDGDVLDVGGGGHVLHVPGHTHGSIALHLPDTGVLFTGDTVAVSPVDGTLIPGVFNLDRRQLLTSCARLAALDTETACFGHGYLVLTGAGGRLRAMVRAGT
ncbi:Glyoxylase-like metal-dependent hydrolase (Beta-lactamase superfamily II) OS=Streptomyces albaduncus OX=68172 GN=FHS32_002048 PE=4 SV=1 [Streptomyces griseoloalbus]